VPQKLQKLDVAMTWDLHFGHVMYWEYEGTGTQMKAERIVQHLPMIDVGLSFIFCAFSCIPWLLR
jgi:hypothetical protein